MFTTFAEFAEWCIELEEIEVSEVDQVVKEITIVDLENTPSLLVAEVLVTASDTGLHFGPFDAERDGGSIIIHV